MEHFDVVTGPVAALDRANVDTDQIIPKQFLKRIERTGYGQFLFWDWAKDDDFPLNRPGVRARADPRRGRQLRLRARRASTPPGRSQGAASEPSSPRRSPTSSAPTAARTGC